MTKLVVAKNDYAKVVLEVDESTKKNTLVFLDSDNYVAYKIYLERSDISKPIETAVKTMQIEDDKSLAQWFQAREHNRVIFEVTDMVSRAKYSCSEVNRFGEWFITI